MAAKWIDIGPISYKSWRNPTSGERGREWTVPGGIVIWLAIAAMVVAGLGWAVPAIAAPGDQRNPTATTRPDDQGDEQGQGGGQGTEQGGPDGQGTGRGNGDPTTTTSEPSTSGSTSTTTGTATTAPGPQPSQPPGPSSTTTSIPFPPTIPTFPPPTTCFCS